jgi:hypothetical protein
MILGYQQYVEIANEVPISNGEKTLMFIVYNLG